MRVIWEMACALAWVALMGAAFGLGFAVMWRAVG